MKIKVEWELEDIVPGEVIVVHGGEEKWIISYRYEKDRPGKIYSLTSLHDGAIMHSLTKDIMAQILTEGRYFPAAFLEW